MSGLQPCSCAASKPLWQFTRPVMAPAVPWLRAVEATASEGLAAATPSGCLFPLQPREVVGGPRVWPTLGVWISRGAARPLTEHQRRSRRQSPATGRPDSGVLGGLRLYNHPSTHTRGGETRGREVAGLIAFALLLFAAAASLA